MEKMGCFEDNMDSRVPSGSCSSASGYSLRSRASSAKISSFCPRSSSKLTQSIVKDHMISHYKKIYSAKAVIDTSLPKSMLYSVKYNDQQKQRGGRGAGLKNGVRAQSAHSLSRRTTASCSPAQSRLSLHYDSSRSMTSTPRPSTSFHPKNTVYAPFSADLLARPSSEHQHRSLSAALRQRSALSLGACEGGHQVNLKNFQDPFQKTYSGDLLHKHAQHFTQVKPFTPKTLKTDKSSYLSKYRFYRAPHSSSKDQSHTSTSNGECRREAEEQTQGFTADRDLSEDFSDSYFQALREHKGTRPDAAYSFPRVSYEAEMSPTSPSADAEEEELRYLEFITAVTDDILSRGFISDSVVERVIDRHLDMNHYRLNPGKMRHLLDVLRKDLKEPCNSPINTLNFEEESPPSKNLRQKVEEETKDEIEPSPLDPEVEESDSLDCSDPTLTSTPTSPSSKTFIRDPIEISEENKTFSPESSKHSSFSEADIHGNQSDSEHKDTSQSEDSERLEEEIQEVGATLESLQVSDQSHCDNEDGEALNATMSDDDEF